MSDSLKISATQQDYLKSQLRYSHLDHLPPPNTLVVHQMQHALIIQTVRNYARQNQIHMIGCGWGDFSEKLDPFHILFFSAIRDGHCDSRAFEQPFRCPEYKADWKFGDPRCGHCGLTVPYVEGDILDGIQLSKITALTGS